MEKYQNCGDIVEGAEVSFLFLAKISRGMVLKALFIKDDGILKKKKSEYGDKVDGTTWLRFLPILTYVQVHLKASRNCFKNNLIR
jgi:hypothetical protein